MGKHSASGIKGRLAAGIAGAALVLGIPSAGLAVGLMDSGGDFASLTGLTKFTPASADPEMARMMEARGSMAGMVRFTPAGRDRNADRAVTVAVRVDGSAAQAISVRNAIQAVREPTAQEAAPRIAPTRYNLGIARGYRSFAQAPALSQSLSTAAIPDLSKFEPSPGVRDEPSRFAARIELGEEERPNAPARRSLGAVGDQSLDVAGSYRLTRNLDVTAGVRYQQDRNRLSPLPNLEQLDSQAVYVGTQFRF